MTTVRAGDSFPPLCIFRAKWPLEREPSADLHSARRSRCELAEGTRIYRVHRIAQVRMVQRIEGIHAKLECCSFSKLEVLQYAGIQIFIPWLTHLIPAEISATYLRAACRGNCDLRQPGVTRILAYTARALGDIQRWCRICCRCILAGI